MISLAKISHHDLLLCQLQDNCTKSNEMDPKSKSVTIISIKYTQNDSNQVFASTIVVVLTI